MPQGFSLLRPLSRRWKDHQILNQAVSVGGWIQKAQVKLCLLMDEGSILHTIDYKGAYDGYTDRRNSYTEGGTKRGEIRLCRAIHF